MQTRTANDFAERFAPQWGLPQITPTPGESFDRNNDLFLHTDGKIYPRHGWQGPVIDTAKHSSVSAACCDAILNYNRATMTAADFADHYDEGDESLMLYGCA